MGNKSSKTHTERKTNRHTYPITEDRPSMGLVRHEVNGKHRVLAAYIIFTLEEAYRYNDRQ